MATTVASAGTATGTVDCAGSNDSATASGTTTATTRAARIRTRKRFRMALTDPGIACSNGTAAWEAVRKSQPYTLRRRNGNRCATRDGDGKRSRAVTSHAESVNSRVIRAEEKLFPPTFQFRCGIGFLLVGCNSRACASLPEWPASRARRHCRRTLNFSRLPFMNSALLHRSWRATCGCFSEMWTRPLHRSRTSWCVKRNGHAHG